MTKSILLAVLLGMVGQAKDRLPEKELARGRLLFFFSRETPRVGELSRKVAEAVSAQKGKLTLRPVLLVEDFREIGRLDEKHPFYQALKELGRLFGGSLDLRLYDEEGLRLASDWKVTKLPTLVLVRGGTAHKVSGAGIDVREFLEVKE